jgi:uncharacterized protein
MRLTPEDMSAIKAAAQGAFGPTAVMRLFGSRAANNLKGGDIDLHVEVDAITNEWRRRGAFEGATA